MKYIRISPGFLPGRVSLNIWNKQHILRILWIPESTERKPISRLYLNTNWCHGSPVCRGERIAAAVPRKFFQKTYLREKERLFTLVDSYVEMCKTSMTSIRQSGVLSMRLAELPCAGDMILHETRAIWWWQWWLARLTAASLTSGISRVFLKMNYFIRWKRLQTVTSQLSDPGSGGSLAERHRQAGWHNIFYLIIDYNSQPSGIG